MLQNKNQVVKTLGTNLNNEIILQTIYDPISNKAKLLVCDKHKITPTDFFQDPKSNIIYYPLLDDEIKNGTVTLPSAIGEAYTSKELIAKVSKHISKHLYLKPSEILFVALYAINTWLYDKYDRVPYLRFFGPYGSGKTHALKVMKSICYHSINIGAGVNEAPIFRMVNKYNGGTLFLDEMNFAHSGKTSKLVQILNEGYQSDGRVTRCDTKTNEPRTYRVFSPKVMANHTFFDDPALESRFFTLQMQPIKDEEITRSLPSMVAWKEAGEIRNDLLAFRLANYFCLETNKIFPGLKALEPRDKEKLFPLLCSVGFNEIPDEIQDVINTSKGFQLAAQDYDAESVVGNALLSLHNLGETFIPISSIKDHIQGSEPNLFSDKLISQHLQMFGARRHRRSDRVFYDLNQINWDLLQNTYASPD